MVETQRARCLPGARKFLGPVLSFILIATSSGPESYRAWAAIDAPVPSQEQFASFPIQIQSIAALCSALGLIRAIDRGAEFHSRDFAGLHAFLRVPDHRMRALQYISGENRKKLIFIARKAQALGMAGDLATYAFTANPGSPLDAGAASKDGIFGMLQEVNRTLDHIRLDNLQNPEAFDLAIRRLYGGLESLRGAALPKESLPVAIQEPPRDISRRVGLLRRRWRNTLGSIIREAKIPNPVRQSHLDLRDTRAYWETHKEEILADVEILRKRMEIISRQRLAELGPEKFTEAVDADQVYFKELPALGKAEITTIAQNEQSVFVIRLVHAPTELSIYFIDPTLVPRDSKHLQQIIARQYFDAGKERTDGKRGRNPIVLWMRDGHIVADDYHEKPSPWTNLRDWLHEYRLATFKFPSLDDLFFGIGMGLIQGILAYGLGAAKLALMGTPFMWGPVIFTTLFGFVIGTFIRTYKNWTYRGHWVSQYIKSSVVSFLFAYIVIVLGGPGWLNWKPLLEWETHRHAVSNVVLNNVGKVSWQQPSRVGEMNRRFNGSIRLFDRKFSRAAVVHQAFYLINWLFRYADLVKLSWGGIPLGRILFISSIPIGVLLAYWYANKHGFPEAVKMRQAPRKFLVDVLRSIFWLRRAF